LPSQIEIRSAGRRLPAAERVAIAVLGTDRGSAPEAPRALRGSLDRVVRRRGWKGDEGQSGEAELGGGRTLAVYGLGEAKKLDGRRLRKIVDRAVADAVSANARSLAIILPDHACARGERNAERLGREVLLAGYRFDRLRSERKSAKLREVTLVPPAGEGKSFAAGVAAGAAIGSGVVLARDLANTPPNEATPAWMVARARELARRHRAQIRVLGPAELRRKGMGGILAVGGGSANPPRMVRLEWGRGPLTIALVGKGVTFDTGGISIKPAAQMEEMKWDKCGACAVLGIFEAVARLRLPVRLRCYLPLAENMPDGAAYRPGDIVRLANGKTVEIYNTDAEGRMILADALAWASSEKPDALIEYSTLTGACVVALGPTGAGVFTPHDGLAAGLLAAAEEAGERLWRLPLWEEFLDEMRGTHADLINSGGRWGGASTAAAFLSQFVGGLERWAHLDIAGPAYRGEGKDRRGATGYGVALTVNWLRRGEA